MGDYRFPNDETTDANGIVRTVDEAFIPVNTELGAWLDYLAWKAVPNTPDAAAATTSLQAYKDLAKQTVNAEAENEYGKEFDELLGQGAGPACALAVALMITELYSHEDGETPTTATRLPLLNQMIPNQGAAVGNVATTMRTWWDLHRVRVGDVYDVQRDAHDRIQAAANESAVDAITWVWPA